MTVFCAFIFTRSTVLAWRLFLRLMIEDNVVGDQVAAFVAGNSLQATGSKDHYER
jgi:hypothetical protein